MRACVGQVSGLSCWNRPVKPDDDGELCVNLNENRFGLCARNALHKTRLQKHDEYQLTDRAYCRLTMTLQRKSSSYQSWTASALLVVECAHACVRWQV